jgi:predicted CoA-binding protein
MEKNPSEFLIEDDEDKIAELIRSSHRIAVLGIKTEEQPDQPAFYVPQYLAEAGLEVIPVPVYYPEVKTILGRPVYRRLVDIPGPPGSIDIVDVFRRSEDVPAHLEDLLAVRPRAVWMQLGIAHEETARRLAEAGILVVQDRCLLVDHKRYAR